MQIRETIYVGALLVVVAGTGMGMAGSPPVQFGHDALVGGAGWGPRGAAGEFVNWETPHVHPLALTPGGGRVLAVNLAAGTLEVYSLASGTPVHEVAIAVGVDPVSVRARTADEAWVVNHLSDSVSIVNLVTGHVVRTLKTADEPCDVVFASGRGFVSCSQADSVQVFDLLNLSAVPTTLALEGNDPRSMAVSPDGSRVYVGLFESGNGTTILGGGATTATGTLGFPPNVVNDVAGPYGGVNPPPNDGAVFNPPRNVAAGTPPRVGLIVKRQGNGTWLDDNETDWTNMVSGASAASSGRLPGWDLIDHDVAIIDSSSLAVSYAGNLMNICMAVGVNPADGRVACVGTDATNHIRFEPLLKGTFLSVNLATFDAGLPAASTVRDLNTHLDYTTPSVPQLLRDMSVGDPRAIEYGADGTFAYVAGMGSNNVIVWDTIASDVSARITVAEGPTGLAIDGARGKLYVLSKFAGTLSVVNTAANVVEREIAFFDPTPSAIKIGRKHLYDTHRNSGLGQISCASCHVDGRMDRLAWDLGDPSGNVDPLTGNNLGQGLIGLEPNTTPVPFSPFHPMKGPMTTQTFQDIAGKEPLHWRGDRRGLENFAGAFAGLQGADAPLSASDMAEFEAFVATITFPPNPFRNFDNSLPTNLPLPGHTKTGRFGGAGQPLPNGSAARGLTLYRSTARRLDGGAFACVTCHTLPTGAGTDHTLIANRYQPIAAGANGEHHLSMVSVDGSTQTAIKTPQIRNAYEKTGFNTTLLRNTAGFGYLHDGSVDSLERFISEPVFNVANDQEVADLVAFVLSLTGSELPAGSATNLLEPPGVASKDTPAAVGAQVTLDAAPTAGQTATINAMLALANANKVGLIARGVAGGSSRGYAYVGANNWQSDHRNQTITQAALLAGAAPGAELTLTVVPVGTQTRLGIDRDADTWLDADEDQVCANPSDPAHYPGSVGSIDVDGDLSIDFFDYDTFVGAFESSAPLADFNADGSIDFFDYDDFVGAFEAGC